MTRSIVIADIAQATGLSQHAVSDDVGAAVVADAILLVILAKFWPHVQAETIAEIAGVSKPELSAAIARYHDHHRRDAVATVVAHKAVTRKKHVPVGEPPTPTSRWCKRGSHWVEATDMARNRSRADGYGDWCKPCWRDYWRKNVKQKQAGQASRTTSRKVS